MSRLTPMRRLLVNFMGGLPEGAQGYMASEIAYRELRRASGEDFGHDFDRWTKWVDEYEASRVVPEHIKDRVDYLMVRYVFGDTAEGRSRVREVRELIDREDTQRLAPKRSARDDDQHD